MKLILNDIDPDDWLLAMRAAKSVQQKNQGGGLIVFEDGSAFMVKRNKASISVIKTS
jgi:hypothetical protein